MRGLVKYVGFNPAFDDSRNQRWSAGIDGHGRKDLRCLLIEAAQAILRCTQTPLARKAPSNCPSPPLACLSLD